MRLLDRLNSLRVRVLSAQGILIAAIIVIALGGVSALQRVRDIVTSELVVNAQIAEVSARSIAALFDQMRAAERYFSENTLEVQADFRTFGDSAHQRGRELLSLEGLRPEDRERITEITSLHEQTEAWYAYAHALVDTRALLEASEAAITARERASGLIDRLRTFSAENARRTDASAAVLLQATADREFLMWMGLASAILLSAAVVVALQRAIDRPLSWLANVAHRYSHGDLRPVGMSRMPRELAQVRDAMIAVGTRLRSLVTEITSQSDVIVHTATDLSAMSDELAASGNMISKAMIEISEGARHQVESLAAGQKALTRLDDAVKENVDVSAHVSDVGGRIQQLAARHGGHVSTAGTTLIDLGRLVEQSAEQVEQLDRLSESIDDFVDLIKQVSSQTNLLALNASIEAARAGAGGQGFAVVAAEVRELSDSSGNAAEEAARTVAGVRTQVAQVAEIMTGGRNQVRGIESVANSAAGALGEIVNVAREIEETATRVAATARTNLQALDEVRHLMEEAANEAQSHASSSEQVSAAAEEQGASTEQIAAQAADLNRSAEALRRLIKGLTV